MCYLHQHLYCQVLLCCMRENFKVCTWRVYAVYQVPVTMHRCRRLASNPIPRALVTDDEKGLCHVIDNCLQGVAGLRCWNHTINSVKLWLRRHGANSNEIPVYVSNIWKLLHQPTENDYVNKLEELQVNWSKPFLDHYLQEIHLWPKTNAFASVTMSWLTALYYVSC